MTLDDRARFWRDHGASDAEAAELSAYAGSGFDDSSLDHLIDCPLPDEPFVAAWERYAADAARAGAATSLCRPLVQLRFPIAAGISESPEYVAAVRRGEIAGWRHGPGVTFVRPDAIRVFLHPTAAGRVPVVVAGAREDFVTLVRAVAYRNEPRPVPDAMGASIIAGYNNWDRIAALGPSFATVAGDKSLYQDRFVILSSGPYSGVPAADVGVAGEAWLSTSLTIRLEHECTHYVTRHALGTMRNAMLDELIADYVGIVAATGGYQAAWFLRFVGLDSPSSCRVDGRIHTYRGTPPLSDRAFAILQRAIRCAASELDAFDRLHRRRPWDSIEAARMIVAIARTGLEGLASADGCARLVSAATDAARTVRERTAAALEVA